MEVPRYWRQRKQRYGMVGETCPHCKSQIFPPRDVCPVCSELNRQKIAVAQHGTLVTFGVQAESVKR